MGIFAHAVGDEGEGPSDARGMPWNGVDDGYIKHLDGRLKDGTLHAGWVDAKIGDPVDDKDVRGKYEKAITCHADLPYIYTELDQRCQTHTYCYVPSSSRYAQPFCRKLLMTNPHVLQRPSLPVPS